MIEQTSHPTFAPDDPATGAPPTAGRTVPAHLTAHFPIDGSEPAFAGHFPGAPIMPGVFTLTLMRLAVQQASGDRWALTQVHRHKLLAPVLPGAALAVDCRVRERIGDRLTLDCRLTLADGTLAATARLALEPC